MDTPLPSPFSHEILNANPYAFLDDAPLEERRARAVELRRVLPDSVLQSIGRLDPLIIEQVQEQAWPDIRNADELQDAMQTLIAFPEDLHWFEYFSQLTAAGRAGKVKIADKILWFAVEKAQTFSAIYPQAELPEQLLRFELKKPDYFDALVTMIRGWILHSGPITAAELAQKLVLSLPDVEQALLKLETTGLILRGRFRALESELQEWCERRLLARIHRLTLSQLRKEIEPVTIAQFIRWLLTWQHLTPGTQLRGEQGLLEVIRQLQGFEIPANAWERQILAKRVADYDPQTLDRLCLMGVIGWGRLSPHPAEKDGRRINPTSIAPITFFVREEAQWLPDNDHLFSSENLTGLSQVAKHIQGFLQQKGASFFADIVRGAGHLKSEIETGLWELVSAGIVTADGFDNLRALIDPRRRSGKNGQYARACYSAGRWSLLYNNVKSDTTQRIEALCWILLKRYGVVFRDLLARESHLPRWRELLVVFRRLEDRGEIRGGRFISGFLGEQFALPYAVESLRAIRKKEFNDSAMTVSAVDPLNLVGIILPGERVTSISGKTALINP